MKGDFAPSLLSILFSPLIGFENLPVLCTLGLGEYSAEKINN
jgi:hypothetical protein